MDYDISFEMPKDAVFFRIDSNSPLEINFTGNNKLTFYDNGEVVAEMENPNEAALSFIRCLEVHFKNQIDTAIQRGRELERAEMGQKWQPIETAPKDGTPVLLYEGLLERIETGWSYDNDQWQQTGLPPRQRITHWMPLPQPPENGQ